MKNPAKTLALVCMTTCLTLVQSAVAQEVQPAQLPSITLPAPLEHVLRDYEVAWRNKDAAGLAALFTEDGFVLSSGRPPVRGRKAIQERYTGRGGPLALRALAYASEDDVGFIIGAFARHEGEPDIGKFTLTLRRDSNRCWLIMSDMDNGNSR